MDHHWGTNYIKMWGLSTSYYGSHRMRMCNFYDRQIFTTGSRYLVIMPVLCSPCNSLLLDSPAAGTSSSRCWTSNGFEAEHRWERKCRQNIWLFCLSTMDGEAAAWRSKVTEAGLWLVVITRPPAKSCEWDCVPLASNHEELLRDLITRKVPGNSFSFFSQNHDGLTIFYWRHNESKYWDESEDSTVNEQQASSLHCCRHLSINWEKRPITIKVRSYFVWLISSNAKVTKFTKTK